MFDLIGEAKTIDCPMIFHCPELDASTLSSNTLIERPKSSRHSATELW